MNIVYSTYVIHFRLYTGPKDTSLFTILESKQYKNLIKNNIHMDSSFNPTEISIQKVLEEPKSALFHLEAHVPNSDKCLVRFLQYIKVYISILYDSYT